MSDKINNQVNPKVEEALGVLDDRIDSLRRMSPVIEAEVSRAVQARTTLAAHIAQQDATIARMREALQEILAEHANDGYRPKAFYLAADALNQEQGK